MNDGRVGVKRRVWVGLGAALLVTGAWALWNAGPPAQVPPRGVVPGPFVRLAGDGNGAADRLLRERADLFDPTPLFFPTEWNYGQRPLPGRMRRQPGQVFDSFGASFTFGDQSIKAYGAEAEVAPNRLVDILTQGNEIPFAGIGQIDRPQVPLAERSGFMEVVDLSNGKKIIAQAIQGFQAPKTDFVPMEFLVAVSSSGIVGDPILMTEPGMDDVDEDVSSFFRTYLVNTFRLGERLMPGQYRVLVGP